MNFFDYFKVKEEQMQGMMKCLKEKNEWKAK